MNENSYAENNSKENENNDQKNTKQCLDRWPPRFIRLFL